MRARQFIQWENEYKCFGQCWVFVIQNASLLSVVSCTENGAWRRSHLELRPFLFTSFASFPALNRGRIFLLRFPLCNFLFGKNLCQLHHQDWINQIFPKFIYIYIWLVLLSFSSLGRWVAINFTQGIPREQIIILLNYTSQGILRFHGPTWLFSSLCQLNIRAKTPS